MCRLEEYNLGDLTNSFDYKRRPLNERQREVMKNNEEELYPYCGANGIVDYIDDFIFNEEIICIAEDGGYWEANQKSSYIMTGPCWVNNHAHVLTAREKLNLSYLNYQLFHLDLTRYITGSTRGKLTRKELDRIRIKVPSMLIQSKIVSVLDQSQSLIDKRKAQLEALDQLAQSVFLEMFEDGSMKFDMVSLGNYTSHVSSGATPRGGQKAYCTQGIPLIRSQNIRMNRVDIGNAVFISEPTHESMKRSQVMKNDVLLNITGASIGRVAVYNGEDNSANVNQHVCIIRTLNINPIYVSRFIASNRFQDSIKRLNSGATREALNYSQIKKFEIPFPPIEVQNQFANIIQQIEAQKSLLQKSLTELENNFQSLMQRAFRGELFPE
ncbi:restriction endonuclease subunit S [Baia soyae]|uniref:Type I restriction enzyme S subunit n=1 Tax=Baia soyae TaxID=1544746 RepID=A0A4R2SCC9_9BACL|nr:restriction endonuclease subunit S [Baia soyae]TCP70486.1 type I restriction enzyme S subunit [Baia soyae]